MPNLGAWAFVGAGLILLLAAGLLSSGALFLAGLGISTLGAWTIFELGNKGRE